MLKVSFPFRAQLRSYQVGTLKISQCQSIILSLKYSDAARNCTLLWSYLVRFCHGCVLSFTEYFLRLSLSILSHIIRYVVNQLDIISKFPENQNFNDSCMNFFNLKYRKHAVCFLRCCISKKAHSSCTEYFNWTFFTPLYEWEVEEPVGAAVGLRILRCTEIKTKEIGCYANGEARDVSLQLTLF